MIFYSTFGRASWLFYSRYQEKSTDELNPDTKNLSGKVKEILKALKVVSEVSFGLRYQKKSNGKVKELEKTS